MRRPLLDATPAILFAVAALLMMACRDATLPPTASAVVVVDTNVDVPRTISRLRIDVFSSDGHWLESRDYPILRAGDWPVTFGVEEAENQGAHVLLRVRGYVDGGTRDYRGVRATDAPPVVPPAKPMATTLGELCRAAPTLEPFQELTLRLGAHALAQDTCSMIETSGTVAAKFHVDTAGSYRFGIVRTDPMLGVANLDPSIFVRKSCEDAATELGCNVVPTLSKTGSTLTIGLQPGDYTMMSADYRDELREDITLRWAPAARWDEVHVAPLHIEPPPAPVPLRLVIRDGDGTRDVTPDLEPDPTGAIDRLVTLDLSTDSRVERRVLLDGACAGRASQLVLRADGTVSADDSATCVGGKLAAPSAALGPDADRAVSSHATFPGSACPASSDDHVVCVPGGTFVIGSVELDQASINTFADLHLRTLPLRAVALSSFLMDRYELTVGRFRQALRMGYSASFDDPAENPSTRVAASTNAAPLQDRTWSARPLGREAYPLNGVRWQTARDLCRFYGGDLPTEAQWEYAALAAGRDRKTPYPWGDEAPTCQRAVISQAIVGYAECIKPDVLAPVDGPANALDVTPLGIVGMGGSLAEYTRSSYAPYDDACWSQLDPSCVDDSAIYRSIRGGSWSSSLYNLFVGQRVAEWTALGHPSSGVRCVYATAPKRSWEGP